MFRTRQAFRALALGFALGAAAFAAETAPPSPVPPKDAQLADASFLSLPAFDLELEPAPAPGAPLPKARVGDLIPVHVQALDVPGVAHPGSDLHPGNPREVSVKPSTPAASAEGEETEWTVLPAANAGASPAQLRFRIVPLKPGRLTLPSVPLLDSSGKAVARTNPLTFDVKSAIAADDPKPKEPAPARPPVSLQFPWAVLVALGILLVLVAAGIVYLIVRLARRTKPAAAKPLPAAPPRPEDEVALDALAALEREALYRKGQFKPHYFRLSEILKDYIGARYRFDAPECTSREIVVTLERDRHPPREALEIIERAFARLDFVKFTDHIPEVEEGGELVARAREFVQMTRLPRAQEARPDAV